ncbi:hypothetical protein [Streptomyces sp. NPDC101776]|uniref:hypothetical protein n=1 Tax=Streptomyces sp. NPDC101776 TaxID=3366146 RepID=UPI003805CAE1
MAVTGILVTLMLPAADLRLALPDNGSAPHASTQRTAYDTISAEFGPGFNGLLLVPAENNDRTATASSQVGAQVAAKLRTLKDVKAVLPPQPTSDPTQSVITVLPASGPDSVRTDRLVREIREEWAHTGRARQSVVDGARRSVRVVTAAALIMFTVFAVRMTLVPAVLALAGRGAWWLPAWLDRILPDLDVEGRALLKATPVQGTGDEPVGVGAGGVPGNFGK